MRADANISMRETGTTPLGTKTELKNVNSFRHIERGLEREIERQGALLSAGERVVQETLHYDVGSDAIKPLRSKEESHDYRYFPEPDLVPLAFSKQRLAEVAARLPELPQAREARFRDLGLSAYDAAVLCASKELGDFYEAVLGADANPKLAANWVTGDYLAFIKSGNFPAGEGPISASGLAELITLLEKGTINGPAAKQVFARMQESPQSPAEIVAQQGLAQVSDREELEAVVNGIIADNPGPAADFKAGKERALGFFVGQVMKQTGGRANPKMVNELIRKALA